MCDERSESRVKRAKWHEVRTDYVLLCHNTFASGLNFAGSINGISDEIFSCIAYIPNIIFELTNFSYDSVNNSTNITGNTYFENSSINTNLNVGSSLNVDTILSQKCYQIQFKWMI